MILARILPRLPKKLSLIAALALLPACGGATGDSNFTSADAALPVMENIALNARSCWFRSGAAAFRAYRLAPELKSYSGRPRILVVPDNAPNERPLLVVEATGSPAAISAYGPLMQTPLSQKITRNLRGWARGGHKC